MIMKERDRISFNGRTLELTEDEFSDLHLLAFRGYIEAADNEGILPDDIDR